MSPDRRVEPQVHWFGQDQQSLPPFYLGLLPGKMDLFRKIRGLSFKKIPRPSKEFRLWTLIVFLAVSVLFIGTKYADASRTNEEAAATLKSVNQRVIQLEETIKVEDAARARRDQEIEQKLQTRLETKAKLASMQPSRSVQLSNGDHLDWMNQAGIATGDYGYVNFIISNESGWNPTIWNRSGSGAYGLGQSLPASKMASYGSDYLTNPVTQLKWATDYAVSRYGSWQGAYNFWLQRHWW